MEKWVDKKKKRKFHKQKEKWKKTVSCLQVENRKEIHWNVLKGAQEHKETTVLLTKLVEYNFSWPVVHTKQY